MWGRSVCEVIYQGKNISLASCLHFLWNAVFIEFLLWTMEVLELTSIHPYTYINMHVYILNYLLLKTSWCSFLKSQKPPWRKTQSKAFDMSLLYKLYWFIRFNLEIWSWVWRVGFITCLCFVSYYLKGCCFLILKKYSFNT